MPPESDDPSGSGSGDGTGDDSLPDEVRTEVERLTRLAREAVDDDEARAYREERDDLLADHGYRARVREDDDAVAIGDRGDTGAGETLVCHPDEWVDDGTVRVDRVDDLERAVEISLSGPGAPEEWEEVDRHNREIVASVRDAHGEAHAENVAALADFMGNHYAKPIEAATAEELREFLEEYYPRNAWPSEDAAAVVEQSVRLAFEETDARTPRFRPDS